MPYQNRHLWVGSLDEYKTNEFLYSSLVSVSPLIDLLSTQNNNKTIMAPIWSRSVDSVVPCKLPKTTEFFFEAVVNQFLEKIAASNKFFLIGIDMSGSIYSIAAEYTRLIQLVLTALHKPENTVTCYSFATDSHALDETKISRLKTGHADLSTFGYTRIGPMVTKLNDTGIDWSLYTGVFLTDGQLDDPRQFNNMPLFLNQATIFIAEDGKMSNLAQCAVDSKRCYADGYSAMKIALQDQSAVIEREQIVSSESLSETLLDDIEAALRTGSVPSKDQMNSLYEHITTTIGSWSATTHQYYRALYTRLHAAFTNGSLYLFLAKPLAEYEPIEMANLVESKPRYVNNPTLSRIGNRLYNSCDSVNAIDVSTKQALVSLESMVALRKAHLAGDNTVTLVAEPEEAGGDGGDGDGDGATREIVEEANTDVERVCSVLHTDITAKHCFYHIWYSRMFQFTGEVAARFNTDPAEWWTLFKTMPTNGLSVSMEASELLTAHNVPLVQNVESFYMCMTPAGAIVPRAIMDALVCSNAHTLRRIMLHADACELATTPIIDRQLVLTYLLAMKSRVAEGQRADFEHMVSAMIDTYGLDTIPFKYKMRTEDNKDLSFKQAVIVDALLELCRGEVELAVAARRHTGRPRPVGALQRLRNASMEFRLALLDVCDPNRTYPQVWTQIHQLFQSSVLAARHSMNDSDRAMADMYIYCFLAKRSPESDCSVTVRGTDGVSHRECLSAYEFGWSDLTSSVNSFIAFEKGLISKGDLLRRCDTRWTRNAVTTYLVMDAWNNEAVTKFEPEHVNKLITLLNRKSIVLQKMAPFKAEDEAQIYKQAGKPDRISHYKPCPHKQTSCEECYSASCDYPVYRLFRFVTELPTCANKSDRSFTWDAAHAKRLAMVYSEVCSSKAVAHTVLPIIGNDLIAGLAHIGSCPRRPAVTTGSPHSMASLNKTSSRVVNDKLSNAYWA